MSTFLFLLLSVFATITCIQSMDAAKHKGASKKLSRIFIFLGISSAIWSIGFGAILIQQDPEYAFLMRCFGMVGTFGTLIFATTLIAEWSEVKKPIKFAAIGFSLFGIIIYIFNERRENIEFEQVDIGMSYHFKGGIWTDIYLMYSIIIALIMFAMVIWMIKTTTKRRKKVVGFRLLWALIVILVGMLFDTILPAFGIIAVPSSTIGQAIGIFIVYSGLDFNRRNYIDIDNVAAYIDKSTEVYILAFDDNLRLSFASGSAKKFMCMEDEKEYLMQDIFQCEYTIFYSISSAAKQDTICKLNGIMCNLVIEKIRDDFGDVIGYVVSVVDLTERMKYIDELNKARDNADKANAAKSAFLASMSHEIRTPLNAVLGMDEMIMREKDIEEIHKHSAGIMDAGKSLLSIIDDILDFSKIESGMMTLAPIDYEVNKEVRELYNIVTFRAKKKGLELMFNVDPNMPRVLHGDELRIRQIFINIINNAIKYTKVGWVKVDITYEKENDGNITLVASVEDTGVGIKKEDIPKLFDKFQRFDENVNHKVEGTGLGLSIVYNLLKMMNGSIDVKSVYERGSKFTVRIPQIVVDNTPVGTFDMEYSTEVKEYTESFKAPQARMLVVDDNQINLSIVRGLLKRTEMIIDVVSSGYECLENVMKNKYDIILLDHMMPEMDGVEVLEHLKKMSKNMSKDAPVIALTANAIVGAKEQYLKIGFDDYIAKPIDSKELEEVILRYLPDELIEK